MATVYFIYLFIYVFIFCVMKDYLILFFRSVAGRNMEMVRE